MDRVALAPDFHDHSAGGWVSSHAHREGQVLLAAEGRMQVRLEAGTLPLQPGQAVWLPPGVWHAARSVEATAFRGVMVEGPAIRKLPRRPTTFAVTPLFVAAAQELTSGRSSRQALAAALLEDELAWALRAENRPRSKDRFAELCARVAADPTAAPELDSAAAQVGMSRRSFTRAFRDATGCSWGEWVRSQRLRQASALLRDGARVSEAALAVGYATPSAFSVAFRRDTGAPPRDARSHAPARRSPR